MFNKDLDLKKYIDPNFLPKRFYFTKSRSTKNLDLGVGSMNILNHLKVCSKNSKFISSRELGWQLPAITNSYTQNILFICPVLSPPNPTRPNLMSDTPP